MRVRLDVIGVLLGLIGLTRPATAAPPEGPVVPLADVRGHTGGFRLAVAEHDPRTAPLTDVAKRIGLKAADAAGAGYDLGQQDFFVYVPKSPADGGKYGVMAGLCPDGSAVPPDAWPDVLERHHLIWIAAVGSGDAKGAVQRVALLLDAVHNVRKAWNVDNERVYLSANAPTGAAAGTAFYYPEVFAGVIQTPPAAWFTKVKGFERPPMTYDADTIPRPQASDLSRAKSHGRFFLVAPDKGDAPTDPAAKADPLAANGDLRRVVRHGYQQIGFKFVGAVLVPASAADRYAQFPADWFEQGITFLDAPLAAQRQRPTAAAGAPVRSAPRSPASPVGPIRVPGGFQVPTPGGFGGY